MGQGAGGVGRLIAFLVLPIAMFLDRLFGEGERLRGGFTYCCLGSFFFISLTLAQGRDRHHTQKGPPSAKLSKIRPTGLERTSRRNRRGFQGRFSEVLGGLGVWETDKFF